MTEVIELKKIDVETLPQLYPFQMDNFYSGILKNLYLEMGYKKELYLFSPNYAILNPEYPEEVEDFLSRKTQLLDYLKLFLVKSLIKYSFLAEANSYYIEENEYTVIARFREKDGKSMRYEIKYYTNSPEDVISHYEDKIYIGRDFIKIDKFERKQCGLKEHIHSIPFEIVRLKEEFNEKIHKKDKTMNDFLKDIEESGKVFLKTGETILSDIPQNFSPETCKDLNKLKSFIDNIRSLKHYLLEIRSALNEFSSYLREKDEVDFVKYTVKFRTDVVNLINFLNFKLISKTIEAISEK